MKKLKVASSNAGSTQPLRGRGGALAPPHSSFLSAGDVRELVGLH